METTTPEDFNTMMKRMKKEAFHNTDIERKQIRKKRDFFTKWMMAPRDIQRKANNNEKSQLAASLQARGMALTKIGGCFIAIPILTAMGIIAGPFGVAGMAVVSGVCCGGIAVWGAGELICPELIHCTAK